MRYTIGQIIQRTSTKETFEVVHTPADTRIAMNDAHHTRNIPAYVLKHSYPPTLRVYPFDHVESDDFWRAYDPEA